jgi:hypothetical protein
MQKFIANSVSYESGENPVIFDLDGALIVESWFRTLEHLNVELVTSDGELHPYEAGNFVQLNARLEGYVGVRVSSAGPFSYSFVRRGNHTETIDPRPLVVVVEDQEVLAEVAMRKEIASQLRAMQLDNHFKNDEAVMELIDDLENGDLEFESEADEFGVGHMEFQEEADPASEDQRPISSEPEEQASETPEVEKPDEPGE